ncbi:MAG: lipoyl synthase [Armatimonadota bacterium]|nr:lipoyl synthase [Armatimonadota bacterium]
MSVPIRQRPPWLIARAPSGEDYEDVRRLVESKRLHTVCQSANCPNIGECWRARTATFMILGNICTRNCRFCAVQHGEPQPADPDEPRRVAQAVAYLKLKHAVITSVTRDDLPDGGASLFAETIRLIRSSVTGCTVEVLVPDFQGEWTALDTVLSAGPEVLNHNVETVPRLYADIRPQARYERSLELLKRAKGRARTKSGLMVGVGETWEEVLQTMRDLRGVGCDVITIGQYLAPSRRHAAVVRFYTPEEFEELRQVGLEMGFARVESGPLVRSSYHAAECVV